LDTDVFTSFIDEPELQGIHQIYFQIPFHVIVHIIQNRLVAVQIALPRPANDLSILIMHQRFATLSQIFLQINAGLYLFKIIGGRALIPFAKAGKPINIVAAITPSIRIFIFITTLYLAKIFQIFPTLFSLVRIINAYPASFFFISRLKPLHR